MAVLIGKAPETEDAVNLVKSYQAQGILVTLVGEICDQVEQAGMNTGAKCPCHSSGKRDHCCDPCGLRSFKGRPDLWKYYAGRRRRTDEVYF